MPWTTACAYFDRPSGLVIIAESWAFFILPSSTSTFGCWARLRPARSERP
ncbi:Uncharacterised protein [Mycobacteroides abscessus subsp. abscessus]|nr:Uncharacterised protein [Mycobacteroides abscessus subsp. abscessus]